MDLGDFGGSWPWRSEIIAAGATSSPKVWLGIQTAVLGDGGLGVKMAQCR